MDLPGRHQANIDAPVEPLDGWDGSIAYLDRDGVLNVGRADYVKNSDEVVLLKGSGHAVAALRAAGYRIVVVTNQSPVNRGMFSHDDLAEMNQTVIDLLLAENSEAHLDLVLYSPYAPWEYSPVRKPGPGMLQVGRQLLSGLPLEVTLHSSMLQNKFDEGRARSPPSERVGSWGRFISIHRAKVHKKGRGTFRSIRSRYASKKHEKSGFSILQRNSMVKYTNRPTSSRKFNVK